MRRSSKRSLRGGRDGCSMSAAARAGWCVLFALGRTAMPLASTGRPTWCVTRRRPKLLLDVGCGEGWLVRAVTAQTKCDAVGIDGSADLIRDAAASDPANTYGVLRYEDLVAGRHDLSGGFDVISCNYALFEEDITPLLKTARSLLAPRGVIIIQTLHPNAFAGAAEGWRTEDFSAFQNQNWTPMPWYLRSLDSWRAAIARAGLKIVETREPKAAPDGPPLSLLLACESATP
jgi:2-polyprenyl-3-methyl-5-hydroxy-6-metoxy-1,4-benzoquinol methylase